MIPGRAGTGGTSGTRGAALAVVLWALIALGILSLSAALAARLEIALGAAHRDHAAALAAAEAGLADALAALAVDPARAAGPDSLAGAVATGQWQVRWEPAGGAIRLVARGSAAAAVREVEARVWTDAEGGLQIAAWKEVW